jgi:hypothetical protein
MRVRGADNRAGGSPDARIPSRTPNRPDVAQRLCPARRSPPHVPPSPLFGNSSGGTGLQHAINYDASSLCVRQISPPSRGAPSEDGLRDWKPARPRHTRRTLSFLVEASAGSSSALRVPVPSPAAAARPFSSGVPISLFGILPRASLPKMAGSESGPAVVPTRALCSEFEPGSLSGRGPC